MDVWSSAILISFGAVCCCATSIVDPQPSSPAPQNLVNLLRKGSTVSIANPHVLSEIMPTVGSATFEDRMAQLEQAIRPMYAALPKNKYGYLGHTTVRYALHRLFEEQHAWFVRGLEPDSGVSPVTFLNRILRERVPSYIRDSFADRLRDRGFSAYDLAAFATTLEHLIYDDWIDQLKAAYHVHELPETARLDAKEADEVLGTFLAGYILSSNLTNTTRAEAQEQRKTIHHKYPAWEKTLALIRDIRQNSTYAGLVQNAPSNDAKLDFLALNRVASELGERYGSLQNQECMALKSALLKLDERGTGRLPLSSFNHSSGFDSRRSLKVEDLRKLGVIYESKQQEPRIIVPNYISSSECIAASSFHSVCCPNECEGLMGRLEWALAAPEAIPSVIAARVAELPSSTVKVPRILSAALLHLLDEVAKVNGGSVPIHGRLFAEWMHHAFPRECPYLHVLGASYPRSPDEWMQETEWSHRAAMGIIQQYNPTGMMTEVAVVGATVVHLGPEEHDSKQLLVIRPLPALARFVRSPEWASCRDFVMFLALAAVAVTLGQASVRAFCTSQAYAAEVDPV